jgi:hypothetical protein
LQGETLNLRIYRWRFSFVARDSIHFPEGSSGNILRGAFGAIFRRIASPETYRKVFEPRAEEKSPSGFTDLPRPFVFRAAHLDGRTVNLGERFHFDLNFFDSRDPAALHYFASSFAELATEGLGPRRGRAELEPVQHSESLDLPLRWDGVPVSELSVRFLTPTELKFDGRMVGRPDFAVLFARARDRVSTIRALYGDGPIELDFRAMGERAVKVEMTECELRHVDVERRSSRTGQVHSIGGFVGEAKYRGELGEFTPILRAAQWTGVGRQTVWGKGAIEVNPG